MARVIEERIIDTINNWKEGEHRLSCRDRVEIDNRTAIYYLWDSPIFKVKKEADKTVITFSFCNWGSQTTKQRISELLWEFTHCYIFRKDWIHYLKMNDKYYKIDESITYSIVDGKLFKATTGEEVEPLEGFKE